MADEPESPDEGSAADPNQAAGYNAADPKAVRKRRVRQRLTEKDAQRFWADILSTPAGRREIWRLLNDQCGAFTDTFACGPSGFPQPEATWHAAGRKSIGTQLFLTLLKQDRDAVLKMLEENHAALARVVPPQKSESGDE